MKTQFVILMVCGLSASVLGQERGYGKACRTDGTIPCTSAYNDPLRCIATSGSDGICGCDTGMFNNIDLNRCVSPHGEKCTVSSDDGSIWRECTEFANCVPSGTPGDKEGVCRCETGAQHDPKSLHCKLGYNSEGCTKDSDCNMNAALACHEGKCLCKDPIYHDYDPETKSCFSLAGGSCSTSGIFDPICFDDNMTCVDSLCTCTPPHIPDSRGWCGLPWGESCVHNIDCSGTLVCQNQKCECPPSQEYSEERKSCTIRAGNACTFLRGLPCVANAVCSNEICTCTSDYKKDENGKCGALFGVGCGGTVSCYGNGYLQCGTGSTCACKDGYVREDPQDKTCKGISGEVCGLDSEVDEDCIAGATCNGERCACKSRHEPATNRTICFALQGQACNDKVVCSESRHLGCTGHVNTCGCKDPENQIFDGTKDRCLARVDKACGAAAGNIECVQNAQCQSNKCECNSGFRGNENGECSEYSGAGNLVASTLLIGIAMVWHGRLI